MSKVPLSIKEDMGENDKDLVRAVNRIDDWKGLDIQYSPVPGGITNPNYKISIDGKSFFLKIPGRGTEAFIDRKNCHVANLIAAKTGIGPGVVYFFEDTGVEVFDWIDGYRTLNFGDVYNREIFLKTADIVRSFHGYRDAKLPLQQTAFEQTFSMMRMARELECYLPPEIRRMEYLAKEIEDAVMTGGIEYKPCHNDFWTNNIVYNDKTGDVKLLDYEYASMNDECYDFGVYSGACYFTEEMDMQWINRYYGSFDEAKFARFKLYKILADIKWSMWAVVQDKISSVRYDYFNWYGQKIARLRQFWNDPRLDYWMNLVRGVSSL